MRGLSAAPLVAGRAEGDGSQAKAQAVWTPTKDTLIVDGVPIEWSLSKDCMVQYGAKVDGKRPTFMLRKDQAQVAPRGGRTFKTTNFAGGGG